MKKTTAARPKGFLRRTFGALFKLVLGVVLLALGVLALFAFKAWSEEYPNERRLQAATRGYVAGAFHVHSTASDGRGTVEEIAEAARSAGLGFVVLTDHNAGPAPAQLVNGVLIIHATELSSPYGHLVALGLPRALTPDERGKDVIELANGLGAHLFLAHPVQTKNPWSAWAPLPPVDGLELYSADTMLREALAAPATRLVPAAGAYLSNTTHALYSLVDEQPEATRRLLQLGEGRAPVALCAHDAHGLPDYEDVFRAMALFVAAPASADQTPQARAEAITAAIVAGDALCVFRALGDPEGFRLDGLLEGTRDLPRNATLRFVPPRNTPDSVRLVVAGAGTALDRFTVRPTGPGILHVELWRRAPGRFLGSEWKPWIVPSPVRVR